MSTGICVCSLCKREVHQDGPTFNGRVLWTHCQDKTTICAGATPEYPPSVTHIRGPWCGKDAQ